MGLLHADLRALANLATNAAGRRIAAGTLFGLGLLALMSWWIAHELLGRPEFVPWLARQGGDSLQAMLGSGLMPAPIAAAWLGLALAQRQLFETGELPLWRQAPLPPWRPAVQVLLRASFVALLWAAALAGPFVATLLVRASAPWQAWLLLPLALLVGTVPMLCTLLAAQVVLVRFFAGRWLRIVFALLGALASVGFSTWLLLGLFRSGGARVQDLATAATGPDRLPWTVATGAELLASAARGALDLGALGSACGWLAVTAALFALAARLHPRAVERHLLAEAPLWQGRRASWPATVAGVMRRKEFAQVLQQPGALVGFLAFGFLVFAMAKEHTLVAGILGDWRLPRELAHLAAMLSLWFLAVLLVLYAHMGRLVLHDGSQWSLYVAAPAAPAAVLRGKLQAVAVFLLWPLLLVGTAGSQLWGAGPHTLLVFAGVALAGNLAALGVLAVVGTEPRLMRPDAGGQIVQGGRNFIAAIVLALLFVLVVSPAVVGWHWLVDGHRPSLRRGPYLDELVPWLLGGALALGLAVFGLGLWFGARNLRRLTRPASPP
jgi:hypothetical protein